MFLSWQVHPTRNYRRKQNSREIFPIHFLLFQIFGKQNVYEPNFAQFLGDFQLDVLLTVLMNLQKQKNVLILGGDQS